MKNASSPNCPAHHLLLALTLVGLLPCLPGCVYSTLPSRPPATPHTPYLVHLPGIAGDTLVDRWFVSGLRDGGIRADAEIFDWTGHGGWIEGLQSYEHNRNQAQQLADRITNRVRAEPGQPVYLTAESGGTGVAVWALERLPEDVKVSSLVLIAPALSPRYDLTGALRHVAGHAYAITSPNDTLVLGLGTTLFGTTDGVHTPAAGRLGFRQPSSADPVQYRKLVPMPYQLDWVAYGHLGGHSGGLAPAFARDVLAPKLQDDAPTASP